MIQDFFKNSSYAFIVAKFATVFQVAITLLVCFFLSLTYLEIFYPLFFLKVVIAVDILFVVLHLIYRKIYFGPRSQLTRTERVLVTFHAGTSLVAITSTVILMNLHMSVAVEYIFGTLFFWVASLLSGIIFFWKKYYASTSVLINNN
jgi:hypothetical protein